MGCFLSILCILLFPFIYFWYQIRQARKRVDEMINNQMNRQQQRAEYEDSGNANRYDDRGTSSRSGSGIKKPHIIKPDEGEYVDFHEIEDETDGRG